MTGRDYIWVHFNEIQGENSKTSKGKMQIIYKGTRIRRHLIFVQQH